VGAGHAHALYISKASPVHGLPAQCKIAAVLLFVLVVVSTPASAPFAFAAYLLLLLAVIAVARLSPLLVLRRMVVEVPFVIFALLLPFVAGGEQVDVLGIGLSRSGLVDGGLLLAKASLGVMASVTLASTTTIRDLLHGLERLHLPRQLVLIASFMVRYADVLASEMARMKVARESRGFSATGLRAWPVLSASLGALFLRSYERGERVHLAMRSRGFNGKMPVLRSVSTRPAQWLTALLLPLSAGLVAVSAALT
jgi:cobalt/nickel transport system permease protein